MKQVSDFRFKKFTISHYESSHKVGTDGVLLGSWVGVNGAKTILDIGTGSGLIALMVAQRTSEHVIIHGIDIQETDAQQAKKNVEISPWSSRISIQQIAAQDFLGHYDLIVSNPPYFINSWLPASEKRAMVRHTESLSYHELLDAVKRCMNEMGKFSVILPFIESHQFISLARDFSLHLVRECSFRSRKHKPVERMMMEFSFLPSAIIKKESLVLYDEGDQWSSDYKVLTRDFYLKM